MAGKSKSADEPELDAPPEVWAEIDAELDAEAEEWKAQVRASLERADAEAKKVPEP